MIPKQMDPENCKNDSQDFFYSIIYKDEVIINQLNIGLNHHFNKEKEGRWEELRRLESHSITS